MRGGDGEAHGFPNAHVGIISGGTLGDFRSRVALYVDSTAYVSGVFEDAIEPNDRFAVGPGVDTAAFTGSVAVDSVVLNGG